MKINKTQFASSAIIHALTVKVDMKQIAQNAIKTNP